MFVQLLVGLLVVVLLLEMIPGILSCPACPGSNEAGDDARSTLLGMIMLVRSFNGFW